MMTIRMYAVKDVHDGKEFFSHIQPSLWSLKLYPRGYDGFFYEVDVSPDPDQSRTNKTGQQYWGWLETGGDNFSMIYPSHPQFSMCFAYGYEANEQCGRGKAYRLMVREVDRHIDDRC
jgi:hypothetical protein